MTSINNTLASGVRIHDCLRKYDTTRVKLFIPRINSNVTTEMIQQDICSRQWGSVYTIKIINYKNGKRIAFVIINWNTNYQLAIDELYNIIENKANIHTFYNDKQHWTWIINNTFAKYTFEKYTFEKYTFDKSGAKTFSNQSDDFAPLFTKVEKVEKLDRLQWLSHATHRVILLYVQELHRQRNDYANNLIDIAWTPQQHTFYTQEKHKDDILLINIKSHF
jgi:hypothetical protein